MFENLLIRLRCRLTATELLDRPWLSELLALGLLAASLLPLSRRRRLHLLAAGARRTETGVSRGLARVLLRPWLSDPVRRNAWRELRIGWERYRGQVPT